jgi:dTMP kinase
MKKLFIVFEGIDGAGTSTQADLLKEYFLSQGEAAILSPEPSDGPIGKLLKKAMQQPILSLKNKTKFDEQMAYLFAADRHYHLYNDVDGVFKLINQDRCHVITTRYYFSSLAYNCHNPEDFEFVGQLNQRFPDPDLVIYLDVPLEESLNRLRQRPSREIYENENKLQQVRQNFLKIFNCYDGLMIQIDARETRERIHQEIVDFLEINFA